MSGEYERLLGAGDVLGVINVTPLDQVLCKDFPRVFNLFRGPVIICAPQGEDVCRHEVPFAEAFAESPERGLRKRLR